MTVANLTLEDAAQELAGNWQDFDCFVWFRQRELEHPEDWGIVYTHNRDSGLLDESNASVIERELEQLCEGDDPDVVVESHSHWLVGHVDGFSIRVYRNGQITEAFRRYYKLAERLDNYPILDESDYSDREYEATLENIPLAAWRLENNFDLPVGWAEEVYSWLSEHRCGEIENVDDLGGWPTEESLKEAFEAFGYRKL